MKRSLQMTKSMVVLIPTEGHTDERVEPSDTPSCMRGEASAVLSYLP